MKASPLPPALSGEYFWFSSRGNDDSSSAISAVATIIAVADTVVVAVAATVATVATVAPVATVVAAVVVAAAVAGRAVETRGRFLQTGGLQQT